MRTLRSSIIYTTFIRPALLFQRFIFWLTRLVSSSFIVSLFTCHLKFANSSAIEITSPPQQANDKRYWDVVRFFVVRFSFVFLFQASLLLSSSRMQHPPSPSRQNGFFPSSNGQKSFLFSKIKKVITMIDISVQLYL
jgi:hypothetical protein